MYWVRKKQKIVKAYSLADLLDPMVKKMIEEKKIVPLKDGTFEVFSQEVIQAGSKHGELASSIDHFRLDSSNQPYPIHKNYFDSHYLPVSENDYQIAGIPTLAWDVNELMSEEIEFLLQNKGLVINKSDPNKYFQAPLWGTMEAADIHAKVLFYSIDRSDDGEIRDVNFNFITEDEFMETYEIIENQ